MKLSLPDNLDVQFAELLFVNTLGASSINETALAVFGNAITSRIDFMEVSNIAILSNPNAIPPCGGAPYRNAVKEKPEFRICLLIAESK